MTIAIDAMGGDYGLEVVVPACVSVAKSNPELKLILVGIEAQVKHHLKKNGIHLGSHTASQFKVVHASEVVGMDESPSYVLRNKKESSMRVAIDLVKEGAASACVSAGNTGALMATARFVLKTLPGIDRPAIIAQLPTRKNCTRMIDLGANVDSRAEHLFQFAIMGSALIEAVDKKPRPKIALLNIGVEDIKGNEQVKRTAQMLSECDLINYVGYIEGDQFYSGDIDLIVCDGFVGNAAIKASEGIVKLTLDMLKASFTHNWLAKISGLVARPVLMRFKERMDPTRYNGASMLGLNGIVIKSHGGASQEAFEYAIKQAISQVKCNVVNLVRDQINDFFNQGLLL